MTGTYVAEESRRLRAAGWALHAYTASGTAIAFLALAAAVGGEEIAALWWLFLALLIDGTDGMLARRLRVKEVIPTFDGARLDDIVDYITYCLVPIFLLWYGGHLPEGRFGILLAVLPLLASSYQFCRTDAKTDDHFFLGFPSYFNVVAFYAIVFGPSPGTLATVLVVCSFLVFVPIRYVYPTRTVVFRRLSLTLTALWLGSYAAILWQMPEPSPLLLAFSILYLFYYFGLSLYLSAKMLEARRLEEQPEA